MSLSEKEILILWNEAVQETSDSSKLAQTITKFQQMIDSEPAQGVSKLYYNLGILYQQQGYTKEALKFFGSCVQKDPHSAIAHYQCGVSLYNLEVYSEGAKHFQKTVDIMRQASVIDYYQLGLRIKVYQHESIYNEALCHLKLGSKDKCLEALQEALRISKGGSYKTVDIEAAIQSVQTAGLKAQLSLCSSSNNNLYTPPKVKLNNLAKKDYLGKAKVVSSLDTKDTFSGFSGQQVLERQRQSAANGEIPKSNSASNLTDYIKQKSPELIPPVRPSSPAPRSPLPTNKRPTSPLAAPPRLPERPTVITEFISGDLKDTKSLPLAMSYNDVLKMAGEVFNYNQGEYSLWYLNRSGTYTIIDDESVMCHVWKWKVQKGSLTLYVFGV